MRMQNVNFYDIRKLNEFCDWDKHLMGVCKSLVISCDGQQPRQCI